MSGSDSILGLVVVVIWGLNFIAIKIGLHDIPPLLLGALRFLVATIPIIFFLPKPPVKWRWLITLGLTINLGQFAFLFLGMKLGMPAGLASLVLQAQAFFTMIIAAKYLGEKWHWNNLAGLLLAFMGMGIVGFGQGGSVTAIGFWLTIAAAASWGIGNIILRRATQNVPPFSMLSLTVWSGAVAILPLFFLSWCVEGMMAWQSAWENVTLAGGGAILYLAYFATLGGYALWGKLLASYPAATVSPFALLVPIVGLSSSHFFLGELLSSGQILGSILVMAGLAVNVFGNRLGQYLKNNLSNCS